MFRRVFISYANEDVEYAKKLYAFLESHGYNPWMDKEKLLPGQNWDYIIQQELRKADFIILLLSNISVSKRGYVQKEFNQALIYCEEKLDTDIYIIPVLIDSCDVPAKLSKFHWLDLGSENSLEKILSSLSLQRDVLIRNKKAKEASATGLQYKQENVSGEYGSRTPKQLYEIKFPQFVAPTSESLAEVNISIKNEVIDYLKRARRNYFEFLKDGEPDDFPVVTDSTMFGQFTFQHLSRKFISYTSFWSLYETGAAHGNYWTVGANFYTDPLRDFELECLFNNFENALPTLRDLVHEKLMYKAKKEVGISDPENFYVFEEGLTADRKNFDNYYIKNDSLVFIYNPYHLTAFSDGDHHPEIFFDELLKNFPSDKKLAEFIRTIRSND